MINGLTFLELQKANGKIRDYKDSAQKPCGNPQKQGGLKVARHFQKRSKEKDYISRNLLVWCSEHAVGLEEEYRFHPDRKWCFDWAVPALMIAVEYEGGIHIRNSSHSSFGGMNRDMAKYNCAQQLGWKVIRFNAINYKELIIELNRCL